MSANATRGSRAVQIVSVLVLAGCLATLIWVLPIGQAVLWLRDWVDGRGFVGVAVFALCYVVAGLAFVPGSALTLAAGAAFGVGLGTAVVSVASTTTAALAFLIARHLARERVASWAHRNPRFAAIDGAIEAQGWRIVALLRLSPVLPFSLGNYLYGLTAVRFLPYVLASWVGMLPGTLLYVLIGDAGATGLAASDGEAAHGTGRTVMLVVGLLATVVATVLVTRVARKALAEHSALDERAQRAAQAEPLPRPSGQRRRVILPAAAVLALVATIATCSSGEALSRAFGPPAVELREAHAQDGGGAVFDHGRFDALLRAHVDESGMVDYEALEGDAKQLERYLAALAEAPFDELGRDEKLALLINAYNAFTLRLILDHMPLGSIRDIPAGERWSAERWKLAGRTLSLDQIEHEEIRPKFAEPRIHFALVCAALGCPPLRAEAYTGARLEEQLADQSEQVHAGERWLRFDRDSKELWLSPLYDWYGGDFRQSAGTVEAFAARHSPELRAALEAGASVRTRFLDYDWNLNRQEQEHP